MCVLPEAARYHDYDFPYTIVEPHAMQQSCEHLTII